MKKSTQYEAKFFAENGAVGNMDFEGDSLELARDHINKVARDLVNSPAFTGFDAIAMTWTKIPDKYFTGDFRKKGTEMWRPVVERRK